MIMIEASPAPRTPTRSNARKAVCAGDVSLDDAQNAIMTDWTTALSSLGLS
ncbi:hypothetical protein [Streptomyces sp. NPDC007205]|uniref:hypothetical protein n=1 Tax=Streptomyces sp. NPDC007205 TaxID=3154316 RepID=UPI0034033F87